MSAVRSSLKLFVGNIPWTISRKELKEYFSQFGSIWESKVIFNKETGLSKNYGFITFGTREGFMNASRCEKHVLEGNQLIVQSSSSHGDKFVRENKRKWRTLPPENVNMKDIMDT